MISRAAEGLVPWGTFETLVYCYYSLFLLIFFLWAPLPALFCTFPFSFLADLIPPLNYIIECLPYAEHYSAAKSLQSCSTLCDPIDGSPPGPAVPGILQARTLEWVAVSSSSA